MTPVNPSTFLPLRSVLRVRGVFPSSVSFRVFRVFRGSTNQEIWNHGKHGRHGKTRKERRHGPPKTLKVQRSTGNKKNPAGVIPSAGSALSLCEGCGESEVAEDQTVTTI